VFLGFVALSIGVGALATSQLEMDIGELTDSKEEYDSIPKGLYALWVQGQAGLCHEVRPHDIGTMGLLFESFSTDHHLNSIQQSNSSLPFVLNQSDQ
jgi:hypothetical protein